MTSVSSTSPGTRGTFNRWRDTMTPALLHFIRRAPGPISCVPDRGAVRQDRKHEANGQEENEKR